MRQSRHILTTPAWLWNRLASRRVLLPSLEEHPPMKRTHSLLFLLAAVLVESCAPPEAEYWVLRHSTYTLPYPAMHLYVGLETDRSGGRYHGLVASLELEAFQVRIREGLQSSRPSFDTYTAAGTPTSVSLANPYTIVQDSSEAGLILHLRVDALEEGEVEVTQDRLMVWHGYGITRYYEMYSRVPRVLIALDAQLEEVSTGRVFYGFQVRGISVDPAFQSEGIEVAMARCEKRFYEKLLQRR